MTAEDMTSTDTTPGRPGEGDFRRWAVTPESYLPAGLNWDDPSVNEARQAFMAGAMFAAEECAKVCESEMLPNEHESQLEYWAANTAFRTAATAIRAKFGVKA